MEDDEDENEDDGEDAATLRFHKGAIAEHAAIAAHHLECCNKAATSDLVKSDMDGDRIRPDGISSIIGEAPNLRAIPRAGQRDIFGKASDGMDSQLAKIIGFSED
jgi:hypothetical protein